MKKVAMTIISTAGLAFGAGQVCSAQGATPAFQIIVNRTDKGVELQCTKGCAWKTATYTCDMPSGEANVRHAHDQPIIVLNGIPVTEESPHACRVEVDDRSVGPAPNSWRHLQVTVF